MKQSFRPVEKNAAFKSNDTRCKKINQTRYYAIISPSRDPPTAHWTRYTHSTWKEPVIIFFFLTSSLWMTWMVCHQNRNVLGNNSSNPTVLPFTISFFMWIILLFYLREWTEDEFVYRLNTVSFFFIYTIQSCDQDWVVFPGNKFNSLL
jgi:hypothetical protein